jgi:hypothetical protein
MDISDPEADPSHEWWEVTTREAADVFEGIDNRPYMKLWFVDDKFDDVATFQREYGPRAFTRMVSALGRKEDCRYMKVVDFSNLKLDGMSRAVLERLFGTILPRHPTLEEMFLPSSVPEEYLMLFTSSIPCSEEDTPLRTLTFSGRGLFDDEQALHAASMIRRNVPLTALSFQDVLTPAGCSMICHAVACNTKLERLRVLVCDTKSEMFHKLAASKSLRCLHVQIEGEFHHSCLINLARELRSNCTIKNLHLRVDEDNRLVVNCTTVQAVRLAFEETLESHNYTIEEILPFMETNHGEKIRQLIRRNAVIRKKVCRLRQSDYNVPPFGMASLLQSIGAFPDPIYRILRNADVAQKMPHKRRMSRQFDSASNS